MTANTNGRLGEDYACEYLKNKGFNIEKRNYRSRFGEIDIIARSDEYLLFVEVKTRSGSLSKACEAVTKTKQKKLITTALFYLEECNTALQPRFDVIEVYFKTKDNPSLSKLCHIENAFEAEDTYI